MDVSALCIPLLISMMVVAKVHNINDQKDAFPHINPNRLQFFQYESVTVNCMTFDGPTEWRVMRKLKELTPTNASSWESSTRSRTIKTAYPSDSGEYWCEDGKGDRSNAVNITVTAGAVILDTPALPVMEGDNVNLHCKTEKTSNLIAEFYKNSVHIMVGYKGKITIHNVSRSDEGLYRCSISGSGESAESRLTVRGVPVVLESPGLPVMEGEAVTLRCVNKISTNVTADFYKNSLFFERSSTGNITIRSVSKSDEGLYRCSISGAGESAESRLTVRVSPVFSPAAHGDNHPSYSHPSYFFLLWIVATVLLVALLLLILLHCKKHKVLICFSSDASTLGSDSDVKKAGGENAADPDDVTYAVVKNQRKERGGKTAADPDDVTYAVVKKQRKKKETDVSRAGTRPRLLEENVIYSQVNVRPLAPA